MKKIVFLLICIIFLFAFVGCSTNSTGDDNTEDKVVKSGDTLVEQISDEIKDVFE